MVIKRLALRGKSWLLLQAIRFFRIPGDSESVARGFAVGLVVNFFPTFGFGVLISGFVARLMGGNSLAGLLGGATLTFAWPILFYLNYQVGSFLTDVALPSPAGGDAPLASSSSAVGLAFMVGAVANSLFFGFAIYLSILLIHPRLRRTALQALAGWLKAHQASRKVKRAA